MAARSSNAGPQQQPSPQSTALPRSAQSSTQSTASLRANGTTTATVLPPMAKLRRLIGTAYREKEEKELARRGRSMVDFCSNIEFEPENASGRRLVSPFYTNGHPRDAGYAAAFEIGYDEAAPPSKTEKRTTRPLTTSEASAPVKGGESFSTKDGPGPSLVLRLLLLEDVDAPGVLREHVARFAADGEPENVSMDTGYEDSPDSGGDLELDSEDEDSEDSEDSEGGGYLRRGLLTISYETVADFPRKT